MLHARRKRTDALAKGNAFLAEGQKGLARDCFVKGVDVTPEMAYQLIKVRAYSEISLSSLDSLTDLPSIRLSVAKAFKCDVRLPPSSDPLS